MLEKKVEEHLCKRVKELGGIAYKFTSPQRRSVPDRLVLLDVAKAGEALRAVAKKLGVSAPGWDDELWELHAKLVVAAMVHFVETKATGAKPTTGQLREHARLRALGFTVHVIDNKEEIDARYSK